MDIHITHNEDNPRAGYSVKVSFRDHQHPPLHFSSPTWTGVFLHLEHLLTGRHASSMPSRKSCLMCRQGERH